MRIGEIPNSVQEAISSEISRYSVGLISLYKSADGVQSELMGSGTLVRTDNIYGILTARHVVESPQFQKAERVGVSLLPTVHHFSIEKVYLRITKCELCEAPSSKPDIAVIVLPEIRVGTIKAVKSFWPIPIHADKISILTENFKNDLWIISGSPAELTSKESGSGCFDTILGGYGISGFTGVDKYWEENDYDYFEVPVSHGPESESPESFRGVSGGGLWHTRLIKKSSNQIEYDRPILSGVAFFQSDIVDERRAIICHGPKSIYVKILSALGN